MTKKQELEEAIKVAEAELEACKDRADTSMLLRWMRAVNVLHTKLEKENERLLKESVDKRLDGQ